MHAEFISPNDARWRTLLRATPHDFYHLPEYIEFAARFEGGEPSAFYAEDQGRENFFLIPLLIRPLPDALNDGVGWRDAVTPYGYPSPIMRHSKSSDSQPDLEEFLRAFASFCQDRKILSVFIRLHPLLALNLEVLSHVGAVIHHGQTVYIDLQQPSDHLWRNTRKGHRQDIAKLEASGFEVHHNCWEELGAFVDLYQVTMENLSAASFYRFSRTYFEEMRSALREHLHLFTVISPTHEVSAAGLFVLTDQIIEYHLSGAHPDYRKSAPTKLMLHAVREWAQEAGGQFFHLGGGLGASNDSLFSFKAGFSKLRADFHTFRIIINEAEYQRLMQRKMALCKDAVGVGDYFPAYRRPC